MPRQTDAAFHATLLAVTVILGGLLETAGPRWVQGVFAGASFNGLASTSAILAALLAAMVIHEAGHLLMAMVCDFEILGVKLGPLRLQRLHGTRKICVSASGLFSCSVSAAPRTGEQWRLRMMLVVAAGPAATLVGAVGATYVAVFAGLHGWAATFWNALALLHFLLFLLGLVPNGESAKVRNDATLFLALKRNGSTARELELYHRLIQLRLAGVRPSDYPGSLMNQIANWQGRAEANVLVSRTLAEWAHDSGDLKLADAYDKLAVRQSEGCDARLRNSTLAASACFDVLVREDDGAARGKFEQVDFDGLFPQYFAHRAQAASLLAHDRAKQAPAQVIRAQYALPRGLAYYDFERMLLEKLHLRALGVNDHARKMAATSF